MYQIDTVPSVLVHGLTNVCARQARRLSIQSALWHHLYWYTCYTKPGFSTANAFLTQIETYWLQFSDLPTRWLVEITRGVKEPFVFSHVCWVFLGFVALSVMSWSCTVVCCQVIDEIYRVLRYVNSTRAPQRAHEVLQELRDISSMAMEYFDEKIVPILKKKLPGADLSGRLIGSAPGKQTFACPG